MVRWVLWSFSEMDDAWLLATRSVMDRFENRPVT